MPTPEAILKTVFGYDQFKPLQREVIEQVLARRDTLVIMPTGSGKSLCYQIPALLFPGLTVVVSPLIALMKDQVEQMQALGVAALFLNSSLSSEAYSSNVERVRAGKVKLLYVAPETLLTERMFQLLSSVPFDCLTIDEAHCISEWGHDFRPEYRQIVEVRRRFPQVSCLALTATATERVRLDIQTNLGFEQRNVFTASFNRDNLLLEVLPKKKPFEQLMRLLRQHSGQSGIIYCFSRKQVDDIAGALRQAGFSALPYHAGLLDEERRANQDAFIRDNVQIIVATIAFGMGINKPNVRFVIHYDLPKSIENYYQEIGRAGRDGVQSHCVLLYSYSDVAKLKYFLDQKQGQERQVAYQHLSAMTRYAEWTACRRVPLLSYFGEQFGLDSCGMCDHCRSTGDDLIDVTIPAQKFLSCVVRTGEIFGVQHVVDVLRGDKTDKVVQHRHATLSTFGIGKDLQREQWLYLGRQLLQKGMLQKDEQTGSLKLSPLGYETLKNRQPVLGKLDEFEPTADLAQRSADIDYDRTLFEALRAIRKELADEERVPPYVIFSDRTLIEMAAYRPTSHNSLKRIFGVGTVKLERYGETFLEAIRQYCKETGTASQDKPGQAVRPKRSPDWLKKPRYIEVAEAFNAGESIVELAQRYAVKATTIIDHLSDYVLDDKPLRAADELYEMITVTEARKEQAMRVFRSKGIKVLKPAFDEFGGQLDYDQLKLLRLAFLIEREDS